jgi:hypothetical protein
MIGVYTSLANYILHLWGALMYFSSHMSHGVIIWLKTEDIKVATNWRDYLSVWQDA